jgi:trehalose utilization protein
VAPKTSSGLGWNRLLCTGSVFILAREGNEKEQVWEMREKKGVFLGIIEIYLLNRVKFYFLISNIQKLSIGGKVLISNIQKLVIS